MGSYQLRLVSTPMKIDNSSEKPQAAIEHLIQVMKDLRDPNTGCPWDIEQSFETIAPYTIEEAYEVADAIDRGNMPELKDELGDLLLQVVYHAQMADELGEFNFKDVAESSSNKMIRRHPHVFGNKTVGSIIEQSDAWEEQKNSERNDSDMVFDKSVLGGIANNLPALLRAYKLQERAARVKFDWPSVAEALQNLKEEISELECEISVNNKTTNKDAILEEVSDVLFSAVNVTRKIGIDPEAALRKGNEKFERRFRYVEQSILAKGKKMGSVSLEELERHWKKSKTINSKVEAKND